MSFKTEMNTLVTDVNFKSSLIASLIRGIHSHPATGIPRNAAG